MGIGDTLNLGKYIPDMSNLQEVMVSLAVFSPYIILLLVVLFFVYFWMTSIPAEVYIHTGSGFRIKRDLMRKANKKHSTNFLLFSRDSVPVAREMDYMYQGKKKIVKLYKNPQGNYTFLHIEPDNYVMGVDGRLMLDDYGKPVTEPIFKPFPLNAAEQVVRIAEDKSKRWHHLSLMERAAVPLMLVTFTIGAIMLVIIQST